MGLRWRKSAIACGALWALPLQPLAAAPPVTTVITHGFSTTEKGFWVKGMAEAICARAGQGSIYRYTEATAAWTYVPSPFADGTNDVVVCIFNWVPESDAPANGPNWNYAQAAGDALYAALRDPVFLGAPAGGPPPSLVNDRWMHLIGHSRGACVNSEATLRFARDGLTVDHVTALDPHPVNGRLDNPFGVNWNDPTPARWNNVAFLDNYWRADGRLFNSINPDGMSLSGAFNTNLSESALNCTDCGYPQSHSDTHLWLHGTIDLGPTPSDGEADITADARALWWPEGYAQRGWFYSRLGGGSAQRPPVGQAVNPPATPFVVNGSFANLSHAGWSFHGGSVSGDIVNQGGEQFLRIGAGVGSSPSATHNRWFLPAGASAIKLETRVLTGAHAAGESLRVTLTDQAGGAFIVANDPIASTPGAVFISRQFAIPPNVPRGSVYVMTLQIVSAATAAAVIGIDDIDLVVNALSPGDINGDGCVNINDLLGVIIAWGPCPAPPQWCPADANEDGTVNINDLLTVIIHWGC